MGALTIGRTILHMVEIDGRQFAVPPTVAREIRRLRDVAAIARAIYETTTGEPFIGEGAGPDHALAFEQARAVACRARDATYP